MKKFIIFKKTWVLLFVFIWNSNLLAQTPVGASFISPGYNSCNAGLTNGNNYFTYPVSTGLTLSQLTHLATDFMDPDGGTGIFFIVTIQSSSGPLSIFLGFPTGYPGVWQNTGNLAATAGFIDWQATYGSSLVTSISTATDNGNPIMFDNTTINGRTYNYDDCDGDGLLDIFDCDPAHGGNNKALVCHSGQTICVALPALQAHLDHGDYMGSCITNNRPATIISPEEPGTTELKLYPNPAEHQINLRINNNKRLGTVSIYDIAGKMIFSYFIGASQAVIDVKHFSPGIYYLRSDQIGRVIKFVKQ